MPEAKPCIRRYDAAAEFHIDEGCYINELSNSENDHELSIARARVKPGDSTRWHSLHGITERYYIQQGTGIVEVGELAPSEVGPGDVVIIPAGCRQRITNNGENDLLFLAICTPPFDPEQYIDLDSAKASD